jgi:hypothetical protein
LTHDEIRDVGAENVRKSALHEGVEGGGVGGDEFRETGAERKGKLGKARTGAKQGNGNLLVLEGIQEAADL